MTFSAKVRIDCITISWGEYFQLYHAHGEGRI